MVFKYIKNTRLFKIHLLSLLTMNIVFNLKNQLIVEIDDNIENG